MKWTDRTHRGVHTTPPTHLHPLSHLTWIGSHPISSTTNHQTPPTDVHVIHSSPSDILANPSGIKVHVNSFLSSVLLVATFIPKALFL